MVEKITHTNLTQSQLLLWTGQQLAPNSPLYNMVLLFEMKGKIDVPHFKKAFRALADQSDALRTVFEVVDGSPQQQVLPHFFYEIEVLDFEDEKGFKAWAAERCQQKFDLAKCAFDSVLGRLPDGRFFWYLNQHHLITDAWGVSVLYNKMADLYAKSLRGELDAAPVLPFFKKYIAYEKDARGQAKRGEVNRFWEEKLAGQPAPPKLYGETNTSATTLSKRVSLDLGQARSDKLRALTQEKDLRSWTQHLSLFNIFSTVLFAYLYRVGGQRKLSIGTPAHNRPTPEFKGTPGVFIEIFPLLAEVQEGDTFGSLYQRVRNGAHGFLRYAQPGAGTPGLSRSFNVVLNYIHATFPDFAGIPTRSEWLHPGHCDPRHHLRMHVHDFDASGSIELHFDLNEAVFDEKMRGEVPGHFLRMLDAFVEDRSQEVGRVPLGSIAFRLSRSVPFRALNAANILSNNVVNDVDRDSLKAMLPKPAILFNGQKTSYQTLEEKSNQLAHFLLKKGIGKGHRAAIFLKRTPDLLTAIFGVLKTGAAYIPIATDYPNKRVEHMLADSQASILLTQSLLENGLPEMSIPVLGMDTERPFYEVEKKEKPAIEIQPEDPAYIMYTSGSTGRPKGVVIPHRALGNYIHWAASQYNAVEKPAMPLFTSIGFDLTVTSIFLPLAMGGTVVVYEEVDNGPDLSLLQVIEDDLVDLIKLTPSHLALLRGKDLRQSRIQTMIVGGEDLRTELAKSIHRTFGGSLNIFNEYGPTEATVGCVLHQFDPQNDTQISVPIGKPAANMEALVLDAFGNEVPDGVTGELHIAGAGLATGYWQQGELTEEKFQVLRNETSKISENLGGLTAAPRIYKTGDLARRNRSGNLEYLGRIDQQVKIGGIRIELGEIEAALASHPAIENCVVELRERKGTAVEKEVHHCTECGLPSNYPTAEFDEKGVCNLCRSFETYRQKAQKYFKTMDDLKSLFAKAKDLPADEAGKNKSEYDCLMLFSGGKDSTYALGQLVDMGLKVLTFTLDNGYISEQAKANIRRVVGQLGVDHVFGETPAMNEIFVDSLHRHSNVCNGCFKTIYTLSIKIALEKGIPYIVTGLSRGQFFETRLTEELFWNEAVDVAAIDQTILEARKAYHRVDDAACRLLDVSMFENDEVFDKVQYVDFYRYTDVSLDEMYAYLDRRLPWVRPTDTGRSTNCSINQLGIYVHKKKEGYNNYAFPYSWDVRMGHKQRDAALEEINEVIDEREVKRMMAEIGYVEEENGAAPTDGKQLVAYYISKEKIPAADLRKHLAGDLPEYMLPTHFVRLEAMPLTANGKIDRGALPKIDAARPDSGIGYVAPRSEFEEILAGIWSEVLAIEGVGVYDNFLELGGHSLAAIRLMARTNEAFELDLPVSCVFEKPTIADIAGHIENTIMELLEEVE
ncbi:MAG TPA: amino acid adenylation domain-containing protein [Bacteroidetes bacterium]|nr:amino acid adenylation domain-containing protein [Bacteroidota bacterium]